MKVVRIDNYDRDYVPDRLIEENVTQEQAERTARRLNKAFGGTDSSSYYAVKPDDYRLKVVEP